MKVTLRTIKRRLDGAIACAESRGFTLAPRSTWEKKDKTCCPLGAYSYCVAGYVDENEKVDCFAFIEDSLGLDAVEMDAFVRGFDALAPDIAEPDRERTYLSLYRLGHKYRERALS